GDYAAAVAVDTVHNVYVTGFTQDYIPKQYEIQPELFGCCGSSFVVKLDPQMENFIYSTYIGGSSGVNDIAVDSLGGVYLTGATVSTDLPNATNAATGAGENAFVMRLNKEGTAAVYSTYYAGTGAASGLGIAVDESFNAYMTGW